ncbi:MAG: ATP-binding protein [Lachnospiraceae bacterium]
MYIESCHIENFGKLQDVHFDFSQQLNVIKEENGWGKSTLAAFLRVMFFGFANEGKRNELEKERKRFAPWQGGVYGGQLVFSHDKKRYEIVRTFGKKEKDDTFELYDADTHLLSEDFSAKIGEELFGLDAVSFARSIYVAQQDCRTVSTDGIHAKLGDLTEDTEDISRFDAVNRQMADLLNKWSPKRKTGEIKKLRTQLEGVEAKLLQGRQLTQQFEQLKQEIKETQEKKEEVQTQLKEAQQELEKAGDQKVLEAQRENYAVLCEKVKAQQELLEKEKIFFPKGLLSEADWQEYKAQVHALEEEQKRLHQFALTNEEEKSWEIFQEKFTKKPPEKVEIERQIADWQERNQQMQSMQKKQNVCDMLQQDVERHEKEMEQPKMHATETSGWNVCMILGVILAVVGIVCFFFMKWMALPILLLAAGIWGRGWGEHRQLHKKTNQLRHVHEAQKQAQKQSISEKKEEIEKLQSACAQLQKEINAKNQLMQRFLERYHLEYREKEALEQLYQLKTDTELYRTLEEKVEMFAWTQKKCLGFMEQLSEFLKQQGLLPPQYANAADDCFTWQCQEWREHRVAYTLAQKNLKEAKEEADEFAKSHNLDHRTEQVQEIDTTDLQKTCAELTTQVELLGEKRVKLSQKMQQCAQETEQLREKETEAEQLKEQIASMEKNYAILQLTQQYLTQACESLTAKYMEPVMKGFRKYFRLLTGEAADGWQLDANSTLSHKEAGQHRQTGWLSAGWQDLTGICLRMAFADAMYVEEKPILIFDDPFVNLDEEKVKGALGFLKEAAKEYQILYFTCHESRALLEEK